MHRSPYCPSPLEAGMSIKNDGGVGGGRGKYRKTEPWHAGGTSSILAAKLVVLIRMTCPSSVSWSISLVTPIKTLISHQVEKHRIISLRKLKKPHKAALRIPEALSYIHTILY